MLRFFYFSLCLVIAQKAFSQLKHNLPQKMLGKWKGTYLMIDANGSKDSLAFEFHFLPGPKKNLWSQSSFYKSQKFGEMEKMYQLHFDSTQNNPNRFVLDEQNGIFIDEVLLENGLYSNYQAEGQRFSTVLRLEGEKLYFELTFYENKNSLKSCSEEDGIGFHVESIAPNGIQYVRMTRFE